MRRGNEMATIIPQQRQGRSAAEALQMSASPCSLCAARLLELKRQAMKVMMIEYHKSMLKTSAPSVSSVKQYSPDIEPPGRFARVAKIRTLLISPVQKRRAYARKPSDDLHDLLKAFLNNGQKSEHHAPHLLAQYTDVLWRLKFALSNRWYSFYESGY
eukprot:gene13732-4653_t